MVSIRIGVVSFNQNEQLAVDELLTDLAIATSPWERAGEQAIERSFGNDDWRLDHFPLNAQGNVVAAVQLAKLFESSLTAPNFVVFYGCAGAVDPKHIHSAFLVEAVNYLSLGTVVPQCQDPELVTLISKCQDPELVTLMSKRQDRELVTLKNKWLCHTPPPNDVKLLPLGIFPLCSGSGAVDLRTLTSLPGARVVATDKVIRVKRGSAPGPTIQGPPDDYYARAEWTYGEAIDFVARNLAVVLVEMESYGIATIAEALAIQDRVVVLRVTTDELTDQNAPGNEQAELLMKGRAVLAHLLARLFEMLGSP